MAHIIRVPLKSVPPSATQADRERMFAEWLALHHAANPPDLLDRFFAKLRKALDRQ
jgi:hypothetical protein